MDASRLHSDTPSALPAGTRLGEFELLKVLGIGGFGIVYLAFDHALEREVAVKEYMPASLAGRTQTMHVTLRSHSDAETFALGLKSFVNEARLLARFDHPSLLKVHRFWEANGTAYMAMPVMRGRTVKEIRLEMVGPPDEAWLRALLDPLLGAIEKLHSEGVYHRDIAPDNIQIEPDGRPVLLDFGAARRVLSDKSQTLTAILKPAYAPIEQYAEAGAVKQGPWTDIYALGATLHFLLLTCPPPPATTRAVHDEASLLTPQVLPRCSADFLNIIDWMLAPRPSDRPQSVAALRDVLDGRVPPPVRRETVPAVAQWDRTVKLAPAEAARRVARSLADFRDDEATMVMPPRAAVRRSKADAGAVGRAGAAADGSSVAPADNSRGAAPAASLAAAMSSKLVPIGLAAAALLVAAFVAVLLPGQPAPPLVTAQTQALSPLPQAAVSPPPVAPVAEPQSATAVAPRPVPAAPSVVIPSATPAAVVNTGAATAALGNAAPAPLSTVTAGAVPGVDKLMPKPAGATATTAAVPAANPTAAVRQTPQRAAVSGGGNGGTSPTTAVAAVSAGLATPRANPSPSDAPSRTQAMPTAAAIGPAQTADPSRAVAAAPEAHCGGRSALSHFICMERECLRSDAAGHPDCLKWRQGAKRE